MSLRATARITGTSKNTVTKLLVDLGEACAEFQDGELSNLDIRRVECDEIWSFTKTYGGGARFTPAMAPGVSDRVWPLTDIAGLLD